MNNPIQSLINKDQELSEHFESLERKCQILEIRMEALREMKNEVLEEMQKTLAARKEIMGLLEELQTILKGV